jgi:hypothetical protein
MSRGNNQDLKLTLRRNSDGYRFRPPVQASADPDDAADMHEWLDKLVREKDGRRDCDGYEMLVEGDWGLEFVVYGRGGH